MRPAIVVVTYNRVESLKRLLISIGNANYEHNDIPLIISIDGGDKTKDEINYVANSFDWKYGSKRIINHETNLGLRNHVLSCGDLSDEYDSVIILEDDLYVNQNYYWYTTEALKFYSENDTVAQFSLYSFCLNIHSLLPFIPLKSEYDTFFMQYPSSWGQCWTKKQWDYFRNWYNEGHEIKVNDKIPNSLKKWPETSWLKYFTKYIIEQDKYVVYPYWSLTTNFNDAGVHNRSDQRIFQSILPMSISFVRFSPFNDSAIIYDAYFEINPRILKIYNEPLRAYEFEVDLYGNKLKDNVDGEYFLSSRPCKKSIMCFPLIVKPPEQNIIHNFKNNGPKLSLGRKESFIRNDNKILIWEYFTLQLPFLLTLSQIIKRIKDKIH